jgi:hypothetical protein
MSIQGLIKLMLFIELQAARLHPYHRLQSAESSTAHSSNCPVRPWNSALVKPGWNWGNL